jgi:hypothetical protein
MPNDTIKQLRDGLLALDMDAALKAKKLSMLLPRLCRLWGKGSRKENGFSLSWSMLVRLPKRL